MENSEIHIYNEFIPLIKEYDEIFEGLGKQNDKYRVEHESLKKQIIKLIHENKTLAKNLDDALQSKNTCVSNIDKNFRDDVINNLRTQLNISCEEKTTTFELWQNSLKIIDQLETELKIYKGNKEGYVSKTELDKEKQKYAVEMKELNKKLKTALSKQDQETKQISQNLEVRGSELQVALESQKAALIQVQDKNSEICELKEKLKNMEDIGKHLKEEVEKREEIIRKLYIIDQDSKTRVLESILLTEAALAEKEAAINREIEAKEEVKELNNTLSETIKNAEEKINIEREIFRKQFNENKNKVLEDMNSIQKQIDGRDLQLEKLKRENNILEEDISRLRKGNIIVDDNNTSKLLILEKNLESTFQKLLISERRLMQMTSERDNLRIDLEQMVETFERDRRTIEIDKQNLERKIKTLQHELSVSNGYVEEYVIQIKELNTKMIEMKRSMTEKITMKDKIFEKILSENINKIRSKNTDIQNEFEIQLKSEHNLNRKWRKETKDILEILQNKIKELKAENNNLRWQTDHSKKETVV